MRCTSVFFLALILSLRSATAADAAAPNGSPDRAKDLTRILNELKSAFTSAALGREALEDLAALAAAVPAAQSNPETLDAIEQSLNRLAADAAAEACSKPELLACAGQKAAALEKLAALKKSFGSNAAASKVIDDAQAKIDADKPGIILGGYWHGAALGAVYYTGNGARDAKWFETPAQKIAKDLNLPYLEIQATHVKDAGHGPLGVLLYPDGAPRARFLLVPGGDPGTVRGELTPEGCGRILRAFNGGMNYMGICSGCFLVSNNCFKLWPGAMSRKEPVVNGPPPDIVIWPFHPLARMRKAGGTLKEVAFTGGANRMTADVPGTEYLGIWRNGRYEGMDGHPALMAYSPPGHAGGRFVVTPAHPEAKEASFLTLMCDYAMRHKYALPRKPIEPGAAVNGTVGDGQNQYYEVRVPAGAAKLEVALSDPNGPCEMTVRHGEPPAPKSAPPAPPAAKGVPAKPAAAPAARKFPAQKVSTPNPKPGVHFIMIHGNHDNIAGVNYTLTVTLTMTEAPK